MSALLKSLGETMVNPGAGSEAAARQRLRLVGARYQLINELGRGGMGAVYRALDRLTGQVVTLKKLKVSSLEAARTVESNDTVGDRLALTQEFRVLASVRHPNIISVLDYGFDDDRQPFFTMDLQENARTIIEAGCAQPIAVRVELLVQTLRALLYLHRHGIIHRDLKPENILVVNDQIKILDFGLSVYRDLAAAQGAECAGTLAYMAPEVLRGEPPTEQCDLYALGVIARELFAADDPTRHSHLNAHRQMTAAASSRSIGDIDPRLGPIVEGLLAEAPGERYRDASQVIAALAVAVDQQLLAETAATRESFLQAAPFVGRGDELATLTGVLRDAALGNGSAWLLGGESGVGKSRLLDETRTLALVDGIVVLRGQAVQQGGGPYHVWRDVISSLSLRIDLDETHAAVLKAVVPEISLLLGREIQEAPAVDSEAAQSRLLLAVEEIVRLQPGPVVVMLEDLQWVGSESLKMWSWLARATEGLPLLMLGSFRNEEAPNLPDTLPATNVLTLRRLDAGEIALLSESMIGAAGRRSELVALLERETEGIPFFIVEVMRALAESAGQLAHVGDSRLPQRVVSGGMQKVIRRRLNHVPPDALQALRTAAVIGRVVDPRLMQVLHPEIVIDDWAARCGAAAVLELHDQHWRFAHDKLRDQLLDDLSLASRPALHRKVAQAIEQEYSGSADYVTALAHHWGEAGEPTNEARYANQAGDLALQSGACQEAIGYLNRTLELFRLAEMSPARSDGMSSPAGTMTRSARRRLPSLLDPNSRIDPDSVEFRLGTIEGGLAEAYYRLGDLTSCREHAERALAHFGQPVPSGSISWLVGATRQLVLRGLQTLWGVRPSDLERTRRVASEVARAQVKLTEAFFYSLRALPVMWSVLRHVNQCEPADPSTDLARAYVMMAMAVPLHSLATAWCRRALDIAERANSPRDVAYVLTRSAAVQLGLCRWKDAEAGIRRADRIAEEVGDLRLWEESRALAGVLAVYAGPFEPALAPLGAAHRLSRRRASKQGYCWSLLAQADLHLRLGHDNDAIALYSEAIANLDEDAMRTEAVWGFGGRALALLHSGDDRAAYESADHALSYIRTMTPVAYWTQQGTAATAEVLLSLLENRLEADATSGSALGRRGREACVGMRKYARRFPLGRPHAYLWEGLLAWLSGRTRRASRLWHKAAAAAEQLGMPYELGRAHLELGRHMPPEAAERRHHLKQAIELFRKFDCAADLARALKEMERSRDRELPQAVSS